MFYIKQIIPSQVPPICGKGVETRWQTSDSDEGIVQIANSKEAVKAAAIA